MNNDSSIHKLFTKNLKNSGLIKMQHRTAISSCKKVAMDGRMLILFLLRVFPLHSASSCGFPGGSHSRTAGMKCAVHLAQLGPFSTLECSVTFTSLDSFCPGLNSSESRSLVCVVCSHSMTPSPGAGNHLAFGAGKSFPQSALEGKATANSY